MRIAAIADVHANLMALKAVLEDVSRARPDQILCLGDLIGYGAHPDECVRLVRSEADVVVAGNHDRDALRRHPLPGTSPLARDIQTWTRGQLSEEVISYLEALPNHHVERGRYIAAHGCFLNEEFYRGYVTGTMLEANLLAIAGHADWPLLAFCGHTHIPMVSWLEHTSSVAERSGHGEYVWPRNARAALINPGSVGQPRDGDPRASYAVIDVDQRRVSFHRTEYDIDGCVDAIQSAGLPAALGERLRAGA